MLRGSILALFLTIGPLVAPARASAEAPLPAVVSLHSFDINGPVDLDRMLDLAEARGVRAALLTDYFNARYEYGIFPFRGLLRAVVTAPSILSMGVEAYRQQFAALAQRHSRLLLVPGLEVTPHYYWTGSLLSRRLTMNGVSRNLFVFGLPWEELPGVPAIGAPAAEVYTWESLLLLAPGLLILPGLYVLGRKHRRHIRLGTWVLVKERRRWGWGLTLVGVGVLALGRGYPYTVDRFSPYDSNQEMIPAQAVIDFANARGALTVWGFPEASHVEQRTIGPVEVTLRSEPYADEVRQTRGFSGVGVLYQQTTRFADPGGPWDGMLQSYTAGRRQRPVWAVATGNYHTWEEARSSLGRYQTVFWVSDVTQEALLAAFRKGRFYAVLHGGDWGLTLTEFTARTVTGRARSGEELRAGPTEALELEVGVGSSDGWSRSVQIALVGNGRVIHRAEGRTPLTVRFRESSPSPGGRYYRLIATGEQGSRLFSNPVFVWPGP